ncbi:MAG: radical SAM protein, partial [Alphaproteobacteria bacterium]|nr:radical SAM protein [Alphaproteobacteria bacterium]
AGTRSDGAADELTTDEVKGVLDEIAALSDETMVVFTGGEPMMRPDLEQLTRHATDLGLMAVVGSNATLLNDDRVARLLAAGVRGVGISLDSLDPAYHDDFRGLPGAWERTMRSIDACRRGGLSFQIHFSVTDDNADELDEMIAFAESSGALVLNVFFLVCTGRGEKVTNISAETYDRVLRQLTEAAHREKDLLIRAKCAPHFKRMAMELDPDWPITLAHGYEAGGCLAGTRYCRVTPDGEITPCPYMEVSAGSVRRQGFTATWQRGSVFQELRAPKLQGRCGDCEYAKLCGGCRARPMARDGDLMGEDFLCGYQPQGGAVIEPGLQAGTKVSWSAEAELRLKRVPSFVRRFVRQRVEAYVHEQGEQQVRPEHLQILARRRFGEAGPPGGFEAGQTGDKAAE